MVDERSLPRAIGYIANPHLDLFWLGSYETCLERGSTLLRDYVDRCATGSTQTLLIDSVIFAEALVDRHPDLLEPFRRLVAAGRIEIGSAWIDRWENLVLGESHIRNYLIGKRWCRDVLGHENRLACHPDIPGMAAQIAQICRGVGIRHYVTARKIFREGRVWRLRSPDGSPLLVMQWPHHYMFRPLPTAGPVVGPHVLERYPMGTVLLSGGAGDLASADDFVALYGQELDAFIDTYVEQLPGVTIGYDTPSSVLAAYDVDETVLAEVSQPIPSVWGVMPDEELGVFQTIRDVERTLLAAETAAACAAALGATPLPPSAATWQGVFHETAPFRRHDVVRPGQELDGLWRMHLFAQDHNGGGEEGALSSFQKRVRQERVIGYCDEVLDHALAAVLPSLPPTTSLVAFNPTLVPWSGTLAVPEDAPVGRWLADRFPAATTSVQRGVSPLGRRMAHIRLRRLAPVGFTALLDDELVAVDGVPAEDEATYVREGPTSVEILTDGLRVQVDRDTGDTRIHDLRSGTSWAGGIGRLTAVRETGNDVTLATDEGTRVEASSVEVTLGSVGPLFAEVIVRRCLVEAMWTTVVRAHRHEDRIDVETGVRWWGDKGWQFRMRLAAPSSAAMITYGTLFHGSRWDDVPGAAGPAMVDEISVADYARYREVQHWLHLDGGTGGMTLTTEHPGFRYDVGDGLEAVLLRTPSSCGDARFHWANAGQHEWRFSYLPGGRDWVAARSMALADHDWRTPVVRVPDGRSSLTMRTMNPQRAISLLSGEPSDGDGPILTSLAPGAETGTAVARLLHPGATRTAVRLAGALVSDSVVETDIRGVTVEPLPVVAGAVTVPLRPWRLTTLSLGRPEAIRS